MQSGKRIVPESKFRHIKGVPSTKDQLFDGVQASETRLESNICAVNRKFIAVVLQTSGAGTFTVLRRDRPGRIERVFRCLGHSTEVLDLSFDRFNPNRLVSGAEDGNYFVWWIPEEGLLEDLDKVQCQLRNSQRRVIQSEWHPCAEDILIGVNIDSITVFNVATKAILTTINTSNDCDVIYNASLNYLGTKIVASFKDKAVRIYDLKTQAKIKEFQTHAGSKPIKVAWLTEICDEDLLVTTGATRMSEREICLWKISDPSEPLAMENLGANSASYNVYYDNDTKVLAFFGRGEANIKFFELMITDQGPTLFSLTTHQASEPHRGVAFGNKLSCNFADNEVIHAVRILPKALEEVSFVVPRRSEQFQADLFPDTPGEKPALTAEQYEANEAGEPIKISVKEYAPMVASPAAHVKLVSIAPREVERSAKSSFSVPPSVGLMDQISSLKAELTALQERVKALEDKE